MKIHKFEPRAPLDSRLAWTILASYFLVVYPVIHFFLRPTYFWSVYAYHGFFFLAILTLLVSGKATPSQLGLSLAHARQNFWIGIVPGLLLWSTLPAFYFLLSLTGFLENDLFIGFENFSAGDPPGVIPLTVQLAVIPLVEQLFFCGLVLQTFLSRFHKLHATYLGVFVFCLAHLTWFDFHLSTFFAGFIVCVQFRLTGTIFAPSIFYGFYAAYEVLLVDYFKPLIPLLGFIL